LDNDAGTQTEFGRITHKALDVTGSSKDSRWEFQQYAANTLREVVVPAVTADDTLVVLTLAQTLTNKTLTSPVLTSPVMTTPQINDTSADHQYIFAVSELGADRTVTMPLLTGNDTFVFAAFAATFTNKTFDANGTGNSLSNVDIADLANGTDGELITWAANAAPAAVAVGTATHVLTSNGVGAAPTFQAAAGGATTFIGTSVASADATVGVTGLSDTYEHYLVILTDMHPASDGVVGRFRVGDSSGVDAGANDYIFHTQELSESAATYAAVVSSGSGVAYIGLNSSVGNTNAEALSAALWVSRNDDGTFYIYVHGTVSAAAANGENSGGAVSGRRVAAIELTQVEFSFSSGNVDTGRMTVYGYNNS
jgi:hypothetical protein